MPGGRLGVGIQDVDQALAESFGLDKPKGALVANVEKGSPAAAGLEAGDVILAFDGQAIETAGQLPALVAASQPGRAATLQVWRGGATREMKVKVGESGKPAALADANAEPASGRLGLTVRPLAPEERESADLPEGLVVEDVDGAAREAGMQPGDVVLAANGKATKSVDDLRRIVSGSKEHVALLVQRGDSRLFVPVELG